MQRTPRLDLRRYRGEWIALDPRTRRVVTHHRSLWTAEREAVKRGVPKPLLLSVPTTDAFFVGPAG